MTMMTMVESSVVVVAFTLARQAVKRDQALRAKAEKLKQAALEQAKREYEEALAGLQVLPAVHEDPSCDN